MEEMPVDDDLVLNVQHGTSLFSVFSPSYEWEYLFLGLHTFLK